MRTPRCERPHKVSCDPYLGAIERRMSLNARSDRRHKPARTSIRVTMHRPHSEAWSKSFIWSGTRLISTTFLSLGVDSA